MSSRPTDQLVRDLGFRAEQESARFFGVFRLIVARPPPTHAVPQSAKQIQEPVSRSCNCRPAPIQLATLKEETPVAARGATTYWGRWTTALTC